MLFLLKIWIHCTKKSGDFNCMITPPYPSCTAPSKEEKRLFPPLEGGGGR